MKDTSLNLHFYIEIRDRSLKTQKRGQQLNNLNWKLTEYEKALPKVFVTACHEPVFHRMDFYPCFTSRDVLGKKIKIETSARKHFR